ncbi:MAG: hydroxymethylglutaryl-CoA synthase [Candidatus Brocadiae bacterium]|nr:hydroxymethylglutaryl-CoA synthase [Candidatus Brocadiia bacterium]
MAGIVGYGSYIPRYRIKVEEIAKVWGTDAESYKKGLMLQEKSVPAPDQDVITMSVEAARRALSRAQIHPQKIGAVYVGSESHPYAVKPSGTVVAEAIGATPEVHCADFEFACKAGTEAMFVAYGLVCSGKIQYGLAIAADTSQGAPGDALEFSAAAGAAAYILGTENVAVEIEDTYSFCTDTPDFWRREYQHYPEHGGRFTGEPAYFHHTLSSAQGIMKRSGTKPEDFKYAIFHQPNGKFPMLAAQKLGFKREQWEDGRLSPTLGNTYSGASPMGLSAVLDKAAPGDLILLVSFGSGAGSDGFILRTTDRIKDIQGKAPKTKQQLDCAKRYLDYGTYAKFRGKILKAD